MDYAKVLQYTKDLDVLYVEDDENLLEDTSEILEDYFNLLDTALNGAIALEKYNSFFEENGKYYDLVITDINMPVMDGEVLIKKIREILAEQPIIVISAHNETSRIIRLIQQNISNFILKPIEPVQLLTKLYGTCKSIYETSQTKKYHQMIDNQNKILDAKVKELSKEILATQRLSVETIGNMVESFDEDTGSHVKRIEAYTKLIVNRLDLDDTFKETIPFASLLHDIGKLNVPKNILQKPAKLDANEFDMMKMHAKIGGEILLKANDDFKKEFNKDSYFKIASDIAYYHHEKYNGGGYPKGLKGDEIPICARVVSLVDVYDALRSKRVYKEGFSHEKSLEIIKSESGVSFDPKIVDIFLETNKEFDTIFTSLAD